MMRQDNRPDAEFCGRVPLNQTNLIQPHGFLLVVDRNSLRILQASDNTGDCIGIPAPELVNRDLSEWLPADSGLHRQISGDFEGKVPHRFSFNDQFPYGMVHAKDGYLIIDVERQAEGQGSSFMSKFQELKVSMSLVEASGDALDTCRVAARELKKISGFDKVMIYRFDSEWNGEVIAEELEEGMESYLGLKFPASDVPRQARELYRRSPWRIIPNRTYEPVRLYPVLNPLTNAFTDLSDSNLRSVAAVHLEYLANMKVCASMSTRILKDGQLWGLISCHHREPRYLSYEMCSVFELMSNTVSSRIAYADFRNASEFKERNQHTLAELMSTIYRDGNLMQGLKDHGEQLLSVLSAEGMAVSFEGKLESFGQTPDRQELEDLVFWAQAHPSNGIYHQPALPSVYEQAAEFAERASGILVLPVQSERGNYIFAFRPEAVRQVNWGGNPNEAIRFEEDRKNYHPRNSFSLWQETVRHTSIPWKAEEIEVAEQFRNYVVEFTLNAIPY